VYIIFILIYFGLSILCDILPYMSTLDSQFIKIVTFDMVFSYDRDIEDKQDMENQLALHG